MFTRFIVCVMVVTALMFWSDVALCQEVEVPLSFMEIVWGALVDTIIFLLLAPIVFAISIFFLIWLILKVVNFFVHVLLGGFNVGASVRVPRTPIYVHGRKKK